MAKGTICGTKVFRFLEDTASSTLWSGLCIIPDSRNPITSIALLIWANYACEHI